MPDVAHIRASVAQLEEHLNEADAKALPLGHAFVPGMYVRTIRMPAGMVLTSKIHKTEHVYVIHQGRCRVTTDEGCVELVAPHMGVTKPGTKRALLILEDTVWSTFHPTDTTDLDELERELIATDYAELEGPA